MLEAKTDPEVPPLPPHITLKHAKAFTSTLLSGDPREGSIIVQTAKELVADLMPGNDADRGNVRTGAGPRRREVTASPGYARWTMPAQPLPAALPRQAYRLGRCGDRAGRGRRGRRSSDCCEGRRDDREPDRDRDREQVEAARRARPARRRYSPFSVLADSGLRALSRRVSQPGDVCSADRRRRVAGQQRPHDHKAGGVEQRAVGAVRLTLGIGMAGLSFHLANVAKRDGGVNLLNLFYGAPLLAPAAIAISGLAVLRRRSWFPRPKRGLGRPCSGSGWSRYRARNRRRCCPRPRRRRCCISAVPSTTRSCLCR